MAKHDREEVRTEALRRCAAYLNGRARDGLRVYGLDFGDVLGLKLVDLPGDAKVTYGGTGGQALNGIKVPIEPRDEAVDVEDFADDPRVRS